MQYTVLSSIYACVHNDSDKKSMIQIIIRINFEKSNQFWWDEHE